MSELARVLHIVGNLDQGGVSSFIMNLYRHIDRRQLQFDFVVNAASTGDFAEEVAALGGRIFSLQGPATSGMYRYGRQLETVLCTEGPFAAVHSHVFLFSGYTLHIARRAGIQKRIAHSHSTHDGHADLLPRKLYRLWMRSLILRNATDMVGCSRMACEALFGPHCWGDSRTQVLNNAIDLGPYRLLPAEPSARHAFRAQLHLPVTAPWVGHVGNFRPVKNHQFLLVVFERLLQRYPQAQLLLVGDGALRAEFEQQVSRGPLQGKVHFLGRQMDVATILGALDIFVFPSLYEGLGIAVIEAQAAGVPCVVADSLPQAVDLGIGLVQRISLEAGYDTWEKGILAALNCSCPVWDVREAALREAGYDVEQLAILMEKLYTHAF